MSDEVCLVVVFVCRRPGRKEVSNSFYRQLDLSLEILGNEPKSCLEVV